jgi:hypothetical protein
MRKGVEMSEIDDLFAEMQAAPLAVSRGLQARVLQDAARLQPGRIVPGAGIWAQVSAFFGGGGLLAGMGTAAVAGLYLGFVQPASMQGISDVLLAAAPMDSVDLMPGIEGFLSEGQSDE